LVSELELERLQSRLHGATPARMLRELAEALEVLTADRVLVLVLEDVQWSDPSTVEGLAYLAQRPGPARLLLLGTYRPVEVVLQGHPLRGRVQELCGRGQVRELRLELLSAADVTAYVAYLEASTAVRKGLTLLATLPESPARTQHELALLLTLGELLTAVHGVAFPEVGDAYTRAHVLCQQLGETPQHFRTLWGLVQFYAGQAQWRTASEVSQQLCALVSLQPDSGFLLEGHLAMGGVALHRGDLLTSRAHLEQSLRFSASLQSSPPTFHSGFVSGVPSLVWLAQALGGVGYADQAQQWSQEALALARQSGHTLSLVYAESYAALLSQCHRNVAASQAHATAAVTLAAAQEAARRVAHDRLLCGWALAMEGDTTAGMAHIHQGLVVLEDVGVLRPYWLSLLAEAYGQAGQPEAGLTVLAEAVTLVATTEERWWEAELYRLQGALLLQLPRPDMGQAAACFQQALGVARRQHARALELRAALSLSRLWQGQGQGVAARPLLAESYSWFTDPIFARYGIEIIS
jgi:predicted ATPase